jgi:hypothetical protein
MVVAVLGTIIDANTDDVATFSSGGHHWIWYRAASKIRAQRRGTNIAGSVRAAIVQRTTVTQTGINI